MFPIVLGGQKISGSDIRDQNGRISDTLMADAY
jgi:hypothetical protein